MITLEKFHALKEEIETAVESAFQLARKNSVSSSYELLIAMANYDRLAIGPPLHLNPHSVDNRVDAINDTTRLAFLTTLMNQLYSFPNNIHQTVDDIIGLQLEMMVYCHTWESKPFLRLLYRLARVINGHAYDWKVNVPEMGKHQFIIKQIRETLWSIMPSLAKVIQKGFHTSLRNAFAHSEYSIDCNLQRIRLLNYSGDTWELENIYFDDWTDRFLYSTLLSHQLLKVFQDRRSQFMVETNSSHFQAEIPNENGKPTMRRIYYYEDRQGFGFYPPETTTI